MLFDFDTYDGRISLSCDDRRGIWSTLLIYRSTSTLRTAGQMPTTASMHTLQLVALTSALRSISKGQITRSRRAGYKPLLIVQSCDGSFIRALEAKIKNDREAMEISPFRSGRNFLIAAAQSVARFDLTFSVAEKDDRKLMAQKGWAYQLLAHPQEVADASPVFFPSVASQTFKEDGRDDLKQRGRTTA